MPRVVDTTFDHDYLVPMTFADILSTLTILILAVALGVAPFIPGKK